MRLVCPGAGATVKYLGERERDPVKKQGNERKRVAHPGTPGWPVASLAFYRYGQEMHSHLFARAFIYRLPALNTGSVEIIERPTVTQSRFRQRSLLICSTSPNSSEGGLLIQNSRLLSLFFEQIV